MEASFNKELILKYINVTWVMLIYSTDLAHIKANLVYFIVLIKIRNSTSLAISRMETKIDYLRKMPGYDENSTCFTDAQAKPVLDTLGSYIIYNNQDYD